MNLLDGEKLLADLEVNIENLNTAINILIENEQWADLLRVEAGKATTNEVVRSIKSGDYTIDKEG